MIKKWKLLESKIDYQNPFLKISVEKLERADGKVIDNYYSVVRKDAAFVVALTEDKLVPLVFQYKNGVKEVIWELPAGFVEDGEEPENAARRELKEETGFESDNFSLIGKYAPNPSISDNRNYVFLARDARKTTEQSLDPNEEIEVKTIPLDALVEEIKSGKSRFIDVQSQLSLLLTQEVLKR
jgi:8-oxo-dGTP pyrophosphatase MutT (NUDIX family)